MKVFFLFILLITSVQAQKFHLHSPEKIKLFADHLFLEKDFLRAALEYGRLPENDSINFKIALSYQAIEKYDTALEKFAKINYQSDLYRISQQQFFKTLLLSEQYDILQRKIVILEDRSYQKYLYLSYLFTSENLPEKEKFLDEFPSTGKNELSFFYDQKKNPPYKSSLTAGLLSALIPGSGKIYTGRIGDGITSFITVSLLSFLSYNNFINNHNFRGWLFAGLGFFFYAGNIYGSAVSAQIYNSQVDHQFEENLKEYLEQKKYFITE